MNKGYIIAGGVLLVISIILMVIPGGNTLFTIEASPTIAISTYIFIGIILLLISIFSMIGGLVATDPQKKKWQVQSGGTLYRIQEIRRACPVCNGPMQYTSKLGGWYCPQCKQYQQPQE